MPCEGSVGADNVAADLRTSRVPSEYKRVVGDSFRKLFFGCDNIQTTKRIVMQTTINLIIIFSGLVAICQTSHSRHNSEDIVVHCVESEVERC